MCPRIKGFQMVKALEHTDSSVSILSHKKEDINSYPGLANRKDLKHLEILSPKKEAINSYPDLAIKEAISSQIPTDHSLPSKKHTFLMKITEFSKRPHSHNLVVKSTKAAIDMNLPQPTKWCLLLYPNRAGFVSLYLYRWDNQPTPIPVTFSFAILNSYQEKSNTMDVKERKMFGGNTRSLGATKFVSREHLLDASRGLLHDDTLTVICQLNVFESGEIAVPTVPSSVQFRNWVEELHFLPHPQEENDKKKARPSDLAVALNIGEWFLDTIEEKLRLKYIDLFSPQPPKVKMIIMKST